MIKNSLSLRPVTFRHPFKSHRVSPKLVRGISHQTLRVSAIREFLKDIRFIKFLHSHLTCNRRSPLRAQRISPGRGRTTCSYFSPDNQKLLFASSHLDPNMQQTEDAAIKQAKEDAQSGRRRRYQWDFDPYSDIFAFDFDSKSLTRLTNAPGYDAECSFSADGKTIVFVSDRDGDPDIFLMNADGSGVRQLTNVPGYDGGPFSRLTENGLRFALIELKKICCTSMSCDPTGKGIKPSLMENPFSGLLSGILQSRG